MKIVIVGGVAGGATAAARARRLNENAEIILFEKGPYISFANCGLPYFISGDIDNRSKLLLQTPEAFYERYRVQVFVNTAVQKIDPIAKEVHVSTNNETKKFLYDKLILAQGGQPVVPQLDGVNASHVFQLWTMENMDKIDEYIKKYAPKTALIAGGGFIGVEMAEAFHKRGLSTTIVELAPNIMSLMDVEFTTKIEQVLRNRSVKVMTGVGVEKIASESKTVHLSGGKILQADLVLLSIGVRPNIELAKNTNLQMGKTGALLVDQYLQTSNEHIYACGDMIEIEQRISGKKVRLPLAGPANRQGRIAATNALGGKVVYKGGLGTSVVKVFDFTVGSTGLTEKSAYDLGFSAGAALIHKDHHASYYPGSKELTLKIVYDKNSKKILGAQGFGQEGVDKRIDVVATALHGNYSVDDLAEIDLSYAPPYSSANDPLNIIAFVAQNDISAFSPLITAQKLASQLNFLTDCILDVRSADEYKKGHIKNAVNISVDQLRDRLSEINKEKNIFVHCRVGFRAHLALRILKSNGYKNVWNITGGYVSIVDSGKFQIEI